MEDQAPADDQEQRFSVGLNPELAKWIRQECKRTGLSRRKLLELAVLEYRASATRNAAKRTDRNGAWRKSDRLLEHLKLVEGWELACEKAGIAPDEAEELQKDPAFMRKVEWARRIYAQQIQDDMRLMGKAKNKFGALQKILEAKDPDYGRLKAEKIQREVGPMLKKLPQYLLAELGEPHRKTVETAFEKFWADCELYLTGYTP